MLYFQWREVMECCRELWPETRCVSQGRSYGQVASQGRMEASVSEESIHDVEVEDDAAARGEPADMPDTPDTPAAANETDADGAPAGLADDTRGPRIIALINQKGGVGKTTTTVNIGAGLARLGHRVLMIDLDPQAHMTLHFGIDPDMLEQSVYELLAEPEVTAADVLQIVNGNTHVIPAQVNLAGVESELAELAQTGQAQHVLRGKVMELMYPQGMAGDAVYDYVLLDCPPSLGLLTVNALSLATEVFVPMQAHFLALQGLSKLLETVSLVRQGLNPKLRVTGVVLCMHEAQTVLASEVVNDLKSFFEAARAMADVPWRDAVVLEPAIRRNIKLAECPSYGQTIFEYEPGCAGAQDYKALVDSVVAMGAGGTQAAGGSGAAGVAGSSGDSGDSGGSGGAGR